MTTSLAALANNPSAHSASTVLMSPNLSMPINSVPSQLSLSETGEYDASQDIKTEFYTREGLWKLVKHGEFVRQQQSNNNNNYQQSQMSGGQMTNGSSQMQTNSVNNSGGGSNEPVNLAYFKYSNELLFQQHYQTQNVTRKHLQRKNYCAKCMKSFTNKNIHKTASIHFDHDDDDDIIYHNETINNNNHPNYKNNNNINNSNNNNQDHDSAVAVCKYCNVQLNSNESSSNNNANNLNQNTSSTHASPTPLSSSTTCSPQSLDVVIFNFAREIYFYEFNLFNTKSPSDMRNLIDKKVYRSFISTCFDVNLMASNLNTLDLQNKSVLKTDLSANESTNGTISALGNGVSSSATTTSTSSASSNSSASSTTTSGNTATKLNLSPSCLSLILAAGFNKGEIHVFDGFKKEASVFYNNNKLVDKTKVTCIKWLPNSLNLFLAGYSSGNIYLYDANIQTQPNSAPIFTKLYQDESFSVHINNHATNQASSSSNQSSTATTVSSSSTSSSTPSGSIASSSQAILRSTNNSRVMNGHVNSTTSSFSSLANSNIENTIKNQEKLILLNSNQQQVQVAKNPLLKWTIGASNPANDPATSEQVFFSNTSSNCVGVNGVNEFAFSPCGSYLAVVSQDGYMRVFSFSYQSNQQMQIQLRCSMKSYFGGLLCCAWSSDGRYIVTGGEDDLITVFSFVEMRVACRGRGHSSWINCCSFDPWTCLNSNDNLNSASKTNTTKQTTNQNNKFSNGNDESDLEEFHSSTNIVSDGVKNLNLNNSQANNYNLAHSDEKKIVISKKNRTISTLSDINYNLNNSSNANNESMVYYRLASCGQDNQICFWDLTEECLKEKTLPHSRSRLTSFAQLSQANNKTSPQLPQIIIQPSDLMNESNRFFSNTIQQQQQQQQQQHQQQIQPIKEHHHQSSIVSAAKSIFSLKHSTNSSSSDANKSSKSKNSDWTDTNSNEGLINSNPNASHKNGSLSITSNFFKKHKRNASLTNTGITNGMPETGSNQNSGSNHKSSKSKSNQVTLNSYKKSSNTINLTETIQHMSDGVNSSKKQTSFNDKTIIQSHANSTFNLCPKLDEIPMIEPLVCKRIATERLNSLVFKEDCFMVSTQDGYVFTWSRPTVSAASNSKNSNSNPLPQLNSEFKTNTTSL